MLNKLNYLSDNIIWYSFEIFTKGIHNICTCVTSQDGSKDEREVDNSDDAALANQKRMNADPLEVMLMNMGYRITGVFDVDEEEQNNNESVQCRPS